jgi:cytochrome c-type biogenesis protein
MTLWPYAASVLAGGLTTLSPCVLPALPIIVGGSAAEDRRGPLALAGGMIASFTAIGLLLGLTGGVIGLTSGVIHKGVAVALIICGAALCIPRLAGAFTFAGTPLASWADGMARRLSARGIWGQFVMGALLGAIWSPCGGPTLGIALGLAAERGTALHAAVLMALFGLGSAAPLVAIAYGAREAFMKNRGGLTAGASRAKLAFGALLLLVGILILTGTDKLVEARLTAAMPDWLLDLTTRY